MDHGHAVLQVRNLRTEFVTRKGIVPAVDGVSFDVWKGRVTGLVGESGCGKSVTSLSILGLVPSPPGRVAGGEILFEGRDLARMSYGAMCAVRGKDISMIFQEPMTSLNPVMTVGRQVGEALRIHQRLSSEEVRRRTLEMFDLVGIPEPENRYSAFPHQLSGGLRQRVMIAMALICAPKLLVADEPTTALDVTIQAQVLELMKELKRKLNTSMIMITHDLGIVAETCDKVAIMYAGRVVEYAEKRRLFLNPVHPYTQGLFNSLPELDEEQEELKTIPGLMPDPTDLPSGCPFHPRCGDAVSQCAVEAPAMVEVEPGHFVACPVRARKGNKP